MQDFQGSADDIGVVQLLQMQAALEAERAHIAAALAAVHANMAHKAAIYADVTRDPQNLAQIAKQPHNHFPECLSVPGESQNGEDKFVFDKYFARPAVKRDGIFFEMGGLNGITFSNSLFYEQCLGWGGILIEAQPDNFFTLVKNRNRGQTRRMWMAACSEDGGMLSFSGVGSAVSGDRSQMTDGFIDSFGKEHGNATVQVPCGPLGKYIPLLGVTRIDFFSLDVEGSEMLALETMDWTKIEVHVLMIEMSGKRAAEIPPLMRSLGFEDDSKGFHFGSTLWVNSSWVE